jgi:hypothetical protein
MNLHEYVDKFVDIHASEGKIILLDLGCGDGRFTNKYKHDDRIILITVDAWSKVNPTLCVDFSTEDGLNILTRFLDSVQGIERVPIITLMIDVIEHMEIDEGIFLLESIMHYSKSSLVVTPTLWSNNRENVENPNLWCYNNHYDLHKSFWKPEMFNPSGFVDCSDLVDLPNYYVGVYEK